MKAKFNTDYILNGKTIYPSDFIEMVKSLDGKVIEVSEVPFGGYDFEHERSTYALHEELLILL